MPDTPEQPQRPGRIIIPGAEPQETHAPRIVTPSEAHGEPAPEGPRAARDPRDSEEDTATATGSRIILPPGVSRETPDDLPERPKLRPLVLMPFSDGKREYVLVNDPLGVIQGQPVLGIEAFGLLQLLDGTLSLTEISAAVMRESKDLRVGNMVRDFIARLDELLMLDSPRFETAWKAMRDAYHPLEIRQAAFDDRSYPAAPDALAAFLDAHFAEAAERRAKAGQPEPQAGSLPRAILAPHLDPRRAGATIAQAYGEIGAGAGQPVRVVVFGTGHSMVGDLLALTRKHFETPLGRVNCDTAFVDMVAGRLGEAAYRSELAHRDEHSIEFQALYLRRRFGDRPFRIVPILCGGFHTLLDRGQTPRDDATFEAMLAAVSEAEKRLGGPTVYAAGVDLSHVGPRFGDAALDAQAKEDIEALDRAALEAAREGDADAWFAAVAAQDDATRICGFAPTYALLRCAGVKDGRLLHYEQSDEPDGSTVSIAAMAWD